MVRSCVARAVAARGAPSAPCTHGTGSVAEPSPSRNQLSTLIAESLVARHPTLTESSHDQRRALRLAAPGAPRRRLEGDHRAAPGRRPALLRRDRQGRRAERGRRAPARAEAHRVRRHAGRRRDRPDAARLLPPGDDRHPRRRRHDASVAEQLGAIPAVDYVVLTAGSFDILAEVVCENDDDLIDAAEQAHPRHRRACSPPRRSST